MSKKRKTAARGRSRGNRLVGSYPRSIEILLKKAAVDSVFKEKLLKDTNTAAGAIDLELKPVEKSILEYLDIQILAKMIANTRVPKQHIGIFRTAKTAAVLVMLLSSTAVMGSGQEEGIEPDVALEWEQIDLAEEKMSAIQSALESYKTDYGTYPSTKEWGNSPGPLDEYLSHSDLFDPWKRIFHYEAVIADGKVINYRLESLGPEPEFSNDNIPCPIDMDKHRFTDFDR